MTARAAMRQRLDQAETIMLGDVADQPQPLVRELPEGMPYPAEALGPLRGAVEAVQRMTQAPLAIPAQSALSIAALATQGFAQVETLGGWRPLSLYCLTIAESGERKSSCDEKLMLAVREHEKDRALAYRESRKAHALDQAIWKKQHDGILGAAKKGPVDRAKLAQIGPEPSAPALPDLLVSEPTYEGLTRLFAEGQPSLGLFSDEGGQFLGGFAMAKDNRQKTLAAFNDLWQGNPIKRTRQGDGAFTLHGRRLSLHLMAQPVVALSLLADPLARDTGFLPRCLICQPSSTIGTRLHAYETIDTSPIGDFGVRLGDLLNTGMAMDPDTRELKPRTLALARDARAALIAFSDEVERAQAPGGQYESIRAFASKAAEQAARIAAVLSLWADLGVPEVALAAMNNGIALARFYLAEALRLSGAAQVSDEVSKAELVRKWMLSPAWNREFLTRRDVTNRGPGQLRESPKAKAAIAMLAEHGWLVPAPAGTLHEGRRTREIWRIINP